MLIPFIMIIQSVFFVYGLKIIVKRNQLEQQIATYLQQNPVQHLYTFDMDVSLKGYHVPAHYYNLWEKEYTDYLPGGFILFNEQAFARQWEGKNVMNNWNYLNQHYTLTEQKDFGQGWKLYAIR